MTDEAYVEEVPDEQEHVETEFKRSPEEQIGILKAKQDALEQAKANEFAQKYQALVGQYGYEVVAQPQYLINPSTNVYELRISYVVNKVG